MNTSMTVISIVAALAVLGVVVVMVAVTIPMQQADAASLVRPSGDAVRLPYSLFEPQVRNGFLLEPAR
jgi:hypothetical protein